MERHSKGRTISQIDRGGFKIKTAAVEMHLHLRFKFYLYTTGWIFKMRGYEAASNFSNGSLPNYALLQAKFEFLFYIVLLKS